MSMLVRFDVARTWALLGLQIEKKIVNMISIFINSTYILWKRIFYTLEKKNKIDYFFVILIIK